MLLLVLIHSNERIGVSRSYDGSMLEHVTRISSEVRQMERALNWSMEYAQREHLVARSNMPNTSIHSRRVRAYSMDQLRARSICPTSEGDTIEAYYARMRNGWKRIISKKVF